MIINWLLSTLAIGITAYIIPGIEISFFPALIAALILGFMNSVIKPLLIVLTLPINILTLGLFTLVINGFIILATSWIVPGFTIPTFLSAVIFAIVLSIVQIALFLFTGKEKS